MQAMQTFFPAKKMARMEKIARAVVEKVRVAVEANQQVSKKAILKALKAEIVGMPDAKNLMSFVSDYLDVQFKYLDIDGDTDTLTVPEMLAAAASGPSALMGDVDGDEVVTIKDVRRVLKGLSAFIEHMDVVNAAAETGFQFADTNQDGQLGMKEIEALFA